MHPSSSKPSSVTPPPPYLNELTTTAGLHAALVELSGWIWDRVAEAGNDRLTSDMSRLLESSISDVALLRAVSVWQNYRTLKFIRGVRISWDYIQREYPVGHLRRDAMVANLLYAAAQVIKAAFHTPTDISAARQAQDDSLQNYIQQIFKQGFAKHGDEDPNPDD